MENTKHNHTKLSNVVRTDEYMSGGKHYRETWCQGCGDVITVKVVK